MEDKYFGMTINERLYESHLIYDFDKAIKDRNAEKLKSLLIEIGIIDEVSINTVLSQAGVV